jgi:peptidoglycan-associated lipoprotein
MKAMSFPLLRTCAVLGFSVVIAACSSGVKLDENASKGAPIENRGATAPGTGSAPQVNSSATGTPGVESTRQIAQVQVNPDAALNDPNSPLSKRSIYFDYDSFVVKDEYRTVIDAHARFLNTNKSRKVLIQGNTDERGSREYNLALGQKRAEAVRKALMTLGVGDAQLEAVSLGEEKPKAPGADEAAFAENRRADMVYQ